MMNDLRDMLNPRKYPQYVLVGLPPVIASYFVSWWSLLLLPVESILLVAVEHWWASRRKSAKNAR